MTETTFRNLTWTAIVVIVILIVAMMSNGQFELLRSYWSGSR